jgi:hypothetical protein
MIKQYQYRLQWITSSYNEVEQMLTLWGVRWIDKICIRRQSDYKVMEKYTGFFQFSWDHKELVEKTMDYLHSNELEYEKICEWLVLFELIRWVR